MRSLTKLSIKCLQVVRLHTYMSLNKLLLPRVQVRNAIQTNTLNSEERCPIVCYTLLPSFDQFVNATPVKIFLFCCESFVEPFFHIFVRTRGLLDKCVTHRYKPVVIRRSQVWWVKPHGAELSSWVLPKCREPVLPNVIKIALSWSEMTLCCHF